MREEITTTDLAKFGARERRMQAELLMAWDEQGLPDEFYDDEVTVMFNMYSGCVFLTNSDFQVAMMNEDKLEMFYNCPYCGHEGFLEEMEHDPKDRECTDYMIQIGVLEEEDEEEEDEEDE